MTDCWFQTWHQDVSTELGVMEAEESQIAELDEDISMLYELLHCQKHLRTIIGVGPRADPLLLADVGDTNHFLNIEAFSQCTGVLPRSHQSHALNTMASAWAKQAPLGEACTVLYSSIFTLLKSVAGSGLLSPEGWSW